MKRALITGHVGFIGRHMWRKLDKLGYHLDGCDVSDARWPCDARDFFRADNTRYDLVIHCAAVVGGRVKIDGAPLEVAVDLSIDAELFQWAMRTKPGRVVYFSSSAAYPISLQQDPLDPMRLWEDAIDLGSPRKPDMSYGWTKLTGELLAQYYAQAGGVVHVFRPFSGYGEDQDLDYPFPAFIDRAKKRLDPFEVWGDGTQVRDFIHVDDIVGAVMAAVDNDVRGPVNLCTGVGTSFNRLAGMVTTAAGYAPEIQHLPAAPIGVRHRVGDPTEMLKFYTPKIGLAEGISRALGSAS